MRATGWNRQVEISTILNSTMTIRLLTCYHCAINQNGTDSQRSASAACVAPLGQHHDLSKRISSNHPTEDFKRPVSPPWQEHHKVVVLDYDAFPGSTLICHVFAQETRLVWVPPWRQTRRIAQILEFLGGECGEDHTLCGCGFEQPIIAPLFCCAGQPTPSPSMKHLPRKSGRGRCRPGCPGDGIRLDDGEDVIQAERGQTQDVSRMEAHDIAAILDGLCGKQGVGHWVPVVQGLRHSRSRIPWSL